MIRLRLILKPYSNLLMLFRKYLVFYGITLIAYFAVELYAFVYEFNLTF